LSQSRSQPDRPSEFAALPFDPWPAVLPRARHPLLALPLAIGLYTQLQARLPIEMHRKLSHRLRDYCHSLRYQHALAHADSQHHDIDGRPVEPVSEVHRKGARSLVHAMEREVNRQQRESTTAKPPTSPPKCPVLTLKAKVPQ